MKLMLVLVALILLTEINSQDPIQIFNFKDWNYNLTQFNQTSPGWVNGCQQYNRTQWIFQGSNQISFTLMVLQATTGPTDPASGDTIINSTYNCTKCKIQFKDMCSNCDWQTPYVKGIFNNGRCTLIVPNCVAYANSICSTCDVGYRNSTVVANSCPAIIPNCQDYLNDACINCQIGYKYQSNQCLSCSSGYRTSDIDKKKCVLAVNNCDKYALDLCDTCITGYLKDQGKCETCAVGYRFAAVAPKLCTAVIAGCDTYALTQDLCTKCVSGMRFSDVDNSCVSSVALCLYYLQDKCQSCSWGYKFADKTNKNCVVIRPILNCLTYSNSDQFNTIKAFDRQDSLPFKPFNQFGIQNHQNSRSFDQILQCTSCASGYKLNSTTNSCTLVCPPSTVFVQYVNINGACISVDINCISYNNLGKCLICGLGYKVQLNICVKKNIKKN